MLGSNGPGASGSSRAGCSGSISRPIRARYISYSTTAVRPTPAATGNSFMSSEAVILVTGGAGYIGAHACRALAQSGFRPIVYDNFSTGHRRFVTGELVVGDLLDKEQLARTFAAHDIAAVMHFAAASLVGESMADPE